MHLLIFLLFLVGMTSLQAQEWWLETDYLLWTSKRAPLSVPLLTSADLNDPLPGALGQPGTKILMGNKSVDFGWRSGFRVTLGGWLESCQKIGFEGSFFALPRKKHRQSISTSGEPGSLNLAVPFFDVTGLWGLNGVPGETVFILPGPISGPGFTGRFSLKMSNKIVGSDINALINLTNITSLKIDFITGFRWLQMEESLSFIGKTAALPDSQEMGFYNFKDSFKTDNNFYGPQMGLKAGYNFNCWHFKGFMKIALGCMNQKVRIKGKSQTSNGNLFYETRNTANQFLSGGVFAEPTNSGSNQRNNFAIVLETGVSLFYELAHCLEVGVGYNCLWLNQLYRPGKQIDRKINPTRTALAEASRDSVGIGPNQPVPFGSATAAPLPSGPKSPKSSHRGSDFWAQGLTVSLNLSF